MSASLSELLGHAKASITLDRYTGVFASMEARTDERLDAALRDLQSNPAASLRPFTAPEVVPPSGSAR